MLREVTQPLPVWDADARSDATLHPGAVLCSWQIHRSVDTEAEVYLMEFRSAGRLYTCPLYLFQPRTRFVESGRVMDPAPVDGIQQHIALAS